MKQLHSRFVPFRFAVIIALSLLLSACGATLETDLTLYTDERYAVTMTVTVSAEVLVVTGPEAIKSQLNQFVAEAKAEGAQARWYQGRAKQAGSAVYVIEMNGKGYTSKTIRDTFRLTWLDYQGRKALKVETSPQSLSSGLAMGVVTLHAGEILASNGKKIGNDSVRWDTPVTGIQAIVIPKSQTSAWPIVGILIVLLILAAGGYFAHRRGYFRIGGGVVPAPALSGSFCPYCGQPTQPGARFCMSCGKELPSC
jgi:hypothetical protein